MTKLTLDTFKSDKGETVTILNIGNGERDPKTGRLRGHSKGAGFWGLIANYIRTEGVDMLLLHCDEIAPPTVAAAPTPTVQAPAPPEPTVPTPAPTVTVVPVPAAPKPTVTVAPAPPTPKAAVPGGKPNHSQDFCPRRMTVGTTVFGLRDGTVYKWFTMANGRASHYRAYKGKDITPASFETPADAPSKFSRDGANATLSASIKAAAPTPKAVTVTAPPVAPCETLPDNVLAVLVHNGITVTLFKNMTYKLAPATAAAA